jgi:hypothetical protein
LSKVTTEGRHPEALGAPFVRRASKEGKMHGAGRRLLRLSKDEALRSKRAERTSERVNLFPGSKYRFGLHGSKSGDSLFLAIR